MPTDPDGHQHDDEVEDDMEEADTANGEGPPTDDGVNDTERRYGDSESPA